MNSNLFPTCISSWIPFLLIGCFSMSACASQMNKSTESLPVVQDFELQRYLGTWYEIARLPHRFEKNLQRVTATYALREDGRISVLNRGYDTVRKKWKDAQGRAWIPDSQQPAILKVSFFLWFAADYRIILLDENYHYAMVTSSTKNYFWLLSRKPVMDAESYDQLIQQAADFGFDIDRIIKVKQP